MAISVTFDEEELSRDYTEVAVGGPTFDTGIIGNPLGIQQRAVRRLDAIRTWKIEFGGLTDAQRLALETFFITKYGGAIGFRFFPPNDNKFVGDNIGTTTGSAPTWYGLKRVYANANRVIERRIVKPVVEKPIVKIGTTIVAWETGGGGAFMYPPGASSYGSTPNPPTYRAVMDWSKGSFLFIVTGGATIPTAGQTIWAMAGEFDVPVFFDTDKFETSDYGPFMDLESVSLIEILPAALGITD